MVEIFQTGEKAYHVSFVWQGRVYSAISLHRQSGDCKTFMIFDDHDEEIKSCDASEEMLDLIHETLHEERNAYFERDSRVEVCKWFEDSRTGQKQLRQMFVG